MNFSKFSFKSKLKSVVFESIRTHFKFNAAQRIQQKNLMNKMMKNNTNFKNIIENKPIIVSKGSANPLVFDQNGVNAKVITRRMKVLNKQIMQSITDVLLTEDIGKDFKSLEVRVTQVRVDNGCNNLNIYWVSKHEDTKRVAQMLDQMKGKLHQHLIDRNFMTSVPWIQFVLDIQENHCEEVERILKKCDFGEDYTPFDKTFFETPYEKISRLDEKPNSKLNDRFENSEKVYEFLTLQKPNDMKMNLLGLNYELIMNIVLSNLKKSRAQHRSFNAVADPLPPPDWAIPLAQMNAYNESDAVYNTEERIKVMKKFLVENRKKKQKLSREARKRQILEQMALRDEMSDRINRLEDNMNIAENEFTEDYCDFDDDIQ